jgi:hypothetical protein
LRITGPNELSVNSVDTIHPVLGAGGLPKGPCKFFLRLEYLHSFLIILKSNPAGVYNKGSSKEVAPIQSQRDPVEHRRRRRTWDRGFSTAAIKNYDEIVVRRARELVKQFEKRVGQEIDVSMWMTYFA